MRYRMLAIVAAVIGAVLATATIVHATMGGSDATARSAARKVANGLVTGGSNGVCKMGVDTETGTVKPLDDSPQDNAPMNTVTFKKSCHGPVVGQFSGEVNTPNTSSFFHMDLRATCVGPAGFASGCVAGTVVQGQPGHVFMQTGQLGQGTRSMTWVFSGLAPGLWTFEALPGGDGTAFTEFRSLFVEAF